MRKKVRLINNKNVELNVSIIEELNLPELVDY